MAGSGGAWLAGVGHGWQGWGMAGRGGHGWGGAWLAVQLIVCVKDRWT